MPSLKQKFYVELNVDGVLKSYIEEATKGDVAVDRAIRMAHHFNGDEAIIKLVEVRKMDKL